MVTLKQPADADTGADDGSTTVMKEWPRHQSSEEKISSPAADIDREERICRTRQPEVIRDPTGDHFLHNPLLLLAG